MRMRKWIAGLLMAAATVVTAGSALAADPTVPGTVYGVNKPLSEIERELNQAGIQDVQPTDWFAGSVTVIVQAGLLLPRADGSFEPQMSLSAGEGIAVFAKVLGIASKTDTPEQALAKAQQAGIVDSSVTADHDMTRLEVAHLLATALGVQPKLIVTPAQYPFGDYDAVTEADRGLLAALYSLGIFKGYEDRTFRPDNTLTRAHIALLVDRILGAG